MRFEEFLLTGIFYLRIQKSDDEAKRQHNGVQGMAKFCKSLLFTLLHFQEYLSALVFLDFYS